ncbi:MAG: RNA methyltransferase [Oscillospiraceae bacterium]
MRRISSRDNSTIRELARLVVSRRERRESGRFCIEGVRLVLDALTTGAPVVAVFATPEGLRRAGVSADGSNIPTGPEWFEIDDAMAHKISDTQSPQGVFAMCEGTLLRPGLPSAVPNGCLLLSGLQDPGNIGTILRSANAFGLSAVILADDCSDLVSPKVMRASMGAAFRVPVYEAESALDAVTALRVSMPVYAATLQRDSRPVGAAVLTGAVVVIGNEGAGLPQGVIDVCHESLFVPIAPGCESLNAAMAATVFAWEMARRRGDE